jgi:hypothetical protein
MYKMLALLGALLLTSTGAEEVTGYVADKWCWEVRPPQHQNNIRFMYFYHHNIIMMTPF